MAQTANYLNGTGTKIYIDSVLLGYLKDSSADVSANMIDTSNKDAGGWSTFLPGRKTGTISGSALMRFDATEGFLEMFADIAAGTEVAVLISNENAGDNELSAVKCLVSSLSIAYPDDDVISYDFELQVNGEVTYPLQS